MGQTMLCWWALIETGNAKWLAKQPPIHSEAMPLTTWRHARLSVRLYLFTDQSYNWQGICVTAIIADEMKWWEVWKRNSVLRFWHSLEAIKTGWWEHRLWGWLGLELVWPPTMQPWPRSSTVFPICENKDDNAVCVLTWSLVTAQWTLAFIHLYESIH